MEVGQWRITTWTGPNRDSVYEWIRGRERRERGEERRIWMLIFAYSYCKNDKKYFIYSGYMTYYQIWFQYDSIRVTFELSYLNNFIRILKTNMRKDKLYFRKVGHAIKFKIREKLN